jgi:hypothetical protein
MIFTMCAPSCIALSTLVAVDAQRSMYPAAVRRGDHLKHRGGRDYYSSHPGKDGIPSRCAVQPGTGRDEQALAELGVDHLELLQHTG